MNSKTNTWLSNNGIDQIDYYTKSSEVIIVQRNRSIKLIIDIIRYHFKTPKNLQILDLGCGDETITKIIQRKLPENNYILYDGSELMANKAKENLKTQDFLVNNDFMS